MSSSACRQIQAGTTTATVANASAAASCLTFNYGSKSFSVISSNILNDASKKCKYYPRECLLKKETVNETTEVCTHLFKCSIENCTNSTHLPCYINMVDKFKDSVHLEMDTSVGMVTPLFCGKQCYNKYLAVLKSKANKNDNSRQKMWNNDGPSEEVNSMQTLLDWVTVEENYFNWRGGTSDGKTTGKTKTALAQQIRELILYEGKCCVKKFMF